MTKLIENVDAVVRHVLGGMSLKDSMTLADIRDVVCEVRRRIETEYDSGSTARTTGLYRFMLPDSESMTNDLAQVAVNLLVVVCVRICNKADRYASKCSCCLKVAWWYSCSDIGLAVNMHEFNSRLFNFT